MTSPIKTVIRNLGSSNIFLRLGANRAARLMPKGKAGDTVVVSGDVFSTYKYSSDASTLIHAVFTNVIEVSYVIEEPYKVEKTTKRLMAPASSDLIVKYDKWLTSKIAESSGDVDAETSVNEEEEEAQPNDSGHADRGEEDKGDAELASEQTTTDVPSTVSEPEKVDETPESAADNTDNETTTDTQVDAKSAEDTAENVTPEDAQEEPSEEVQVKKKSSRKLKAQ